MITVKVSSKWLHHQFGCTEDYILNNCHGRCCEGTNRITVCLLPKEAEWHKRIGHDVIGGLLLPNPKTEKCPHKETSGLCALHGTPYKPFGCIASPFTINKTGTLIIRHRYIHLKCHGKGVPAHAVFRASLDLLFGHKCVEDIICRLNGDSGDFFVDMNDSIYRKVLYLDKLKHGEGISKMPSKSVEF